MGIRKGKNRIFRRSLWARILACLVVFATTYALVLPAITLDEDTASTEPGIVIKQAAEEEKTEAAKEQKASENETKAAEPETTKETEPETTKAAEPETTKAAEPETIKAAEPETTEKEEPAETEPPKEIEDTEKTAESAEEPEKTAETAEASASEEGAAPTEENTESIPEPQESGNAGTELPEDTEETAGQAEGPGESKETVGTMDPLSSETDSGETGTLPDETEDPARAAEFPAQTFEQVIGSLRVYVEAAEGTFPAGTGMQVVPVEDDEILKAITDAVDSEVRSVAAVDITFFCGGEKVEPAQPVRVSITSEVIAQAEDPCVVHLTEEGRAEIIEQKTEEELEEAPADDEVVFDADSFSVYAVVDTETISTRVLTADGSTYIISLTYDNTAGIPEGAELCVIEILESMPGYDSYCLQTLHALEAEDAVSFVRFFDISIVKDGAEIQPDGPVEVRIELSDTLDGSVRAIHFGDEVGLIDVSLESGGNGEDNAVVFNAEGFSVYGVVTVGVDELDGKNYGILNNQDTVSGTALLTGAADNDTKLKGKSLTVRTEPVQRTGIVFVAKDSTIPMWSFHSAGTSGQYYITTVVSGTVKYLRVGESGVSLVDESQVDADCRITIEAGSGAYQGKYRFSGSSGKILQLNGNNFAIANAGTNNGNVWMNLAELSTLTEEDFVTYTATKVSVSDLENVKNGAQIVVYIRIWNEETLRYEYYTIDYDGMLVRAYESGDTISWVGTKINTMLWDFTEYYYEGTTTPNNYYELQNVYSGKYIAPQVSGDGFLSDSTIGINLNGRRNGQYYTTILAWDDPYYDYASLKANEEGQLISVPMSQAADFYFAIMTTPEQTEQLTQVATIDHKPFGITLKMQDYEHINSSNRSQEQVDVLGNTPYNQWTGSPGLLEKNMTGDYPNVVNSSHSLSELYNNTMEVNQQFLLTTYEETGYFEYDSTQNFAHLIANENDPWIGKPNQTGGTYQLGDFVIYDQLGTSSEGNKDTLKHGQFLPYNDIVEANGDPIRVSTKYVNEMDIHAQPLSSLDPRKGEALYEIPYSKGQTAPNYVDHFFGMEMSANFMQSENGLDAWGHDLIFEFSGDDDFWLYIDGKLVLDLGGIHSALDGSINFRTGRVIVNGNPTTLRELYKAAYLEDHPDDDEATVNAWLDTIFKDGGTVFKDYSGHTMRMFYMERGAGASNLHMRFNLAPYTHGEVLLEKEVSGTDNVSYTDVRFPFQIWYKDTSRPDEAFVLWTQPEKVTDKQTGEQIPYSASSEIGGKTYQHVYYLTPGQTASIELPTEETEYYIVECGLDSQTFDSVFINRSETPLAPTEETAPENVIYKDYRIEETTVANRKKVIYDNHVGQSTLKNLNITKRVWADMEKQHEWLNDTTLFRFRIYVGRGSGGKYGYSVYSFGKYYVKDPEGNYCIYQNGGFVSTGISDFSQLSTEIPPGEMKSQQEKATFYTSQGGMADNIPARYTIEVPGLMDGTPFYVEERSGEIPAGYELIDYDIEGGEYTPDDLIGDTENYGVIRSDKADPAIIVNNRHGYGLTVNKIWSDAPFMESHDPIYFAVYRKNGDADPVLVTDSVRQMKHPDTAYTWFFPELEDGYTLNDYLVYEVKLVFPEGTEPVIDPDTQAVSGYSSIVRVEENGTLIVHGVSNEHGYSDDYVYTANYTRQFLSEEEIAAKANSRTDNVKNSRPGIKLIKTDLNGEPLTGGFFTLAEVSENTGGEGQEEPLTKTFTSDENGLIAVAYLAQGKDYILIETASPEHYQILISELVIRVQVDENGDYRLLVNDSAEDDPQGYYTITQVAEPTVTEMPTVTIKNRPFTLKAVKVDVDTNQPMQGVRFALFSQQTDYNTGNPIPDYVPMAGFEELITDEYGVIPKIDTEHLRAGNYYLREMETPAGYKPLGGDIRFEISKTGEVTILSAPQGAAEVQTPTNDGYILRVKNTPKKTARILKKSAEDETVMAGVEFELYSINQLEDGLPRPGEEPLISGVTGEDGILNLGVLDDNLTYYLFETGTWDGYILPGVPVVINSTAQKVTATLNGTALNVVNKGTSDRQIWQITVYNSTGVELPATGGPGLHKITLSGLLLATAAALMYVFRWRRRERRSKT